MTLNKEKPAFEHRIPTLTDEVKKMSKDGSYTIPLPSIEKGMIMIDGKKLANTLVLRCHSLGVSSEGTIFACNNGFKTIVGGGTGDQCEIVDCVKCRTSYMVRTIYDNEGHLKVNASPWDTSRNIKNYTFRRFDDEGNFIIDFNTPDDERAKPQEEK